jgi:glucose/mannose-6-phosphate isomerase
MAPVALRWKTQLNENSKVPCYYALFSELNHNEIMGWEAEEDLTEKFYVIFIKDKDDGVRIRLRMKLTREIIQGKAAGSEEIETEGQGILTRLLSVIYLGDWVSFYLALLRRVNPTRIKSIEFLKAELGKIPFK